MIRTICMYVHSFISFHLLRRIQRHMAIPLNENGDTAYQITVYRERLSHRTNEAGEKVFHVKTNSVSSSFLGTTCV